MGTTKITAARYNELRALVNKILGPTDLITPTVDYGYGQSTSTSAVTGNFEANAANTSKITAEQYSQLYTDLIRIRTHQIGAANISIDPFVEGNITVNPSADIIEESYIQGLELLAANIETDRFLIDADTQAAAATLTSSAGDPITSFYNQTLRGVWYTTLEHIVDVSFSSQASLCHFFNAGGQLRISANHDYTGTQAKSVAWRNAINGMGVNAIAGNRTYNLLGLGSESTGVHALTSSYTLLYRISTGAGGVYLSNYYELYGLRLSPTVIRIRVRFLDGLPNNTTFGIDEPVFGNFTSSVNLLIPDGSVDIAGSTIDTVVYNDVITGTTVSNL